MALVTVGNTRKGNSWNVRYENYFVTAEYMASCQFIHYKVIMPERSYGKKIKIGFYVRYPSSNQYRNLYGYYPKTLIPAVFKAENGVPIELLSEGHFSFQINDIRDDWQIYEIYLKRDFEAGEEIWAGVWGETLTPVWDSQSVSKGTCGERMIYMLWKIGRRDDYAPYFDNGQIMNCIDDDFQPKGNYSLYWQYYNAPIPNDCNVKVGNPRMGNKWLETRTVESEDDDGEPYEEDITLDFVSALNFMGYFYQIPKAMINNKIYLHVYNRHPVTEMYEEIEGETDIDFIPVVYKCDSSGKFTELLTSEVFAVTRDFGYDGWIDVELNLKRLLNAGEYIFVGYYSFGVNNVWHENPSWIVGSTVEKRYFTPGYYISYIVGAIRDASILGRQYRDLPTEYYSIYFEYCDIPPSTDYVRSVSSSGNVAGVCFRSTGLKTVLEEIKNIRDSEERKLALFRLFSDVKRVQDIGERKTTTKRNLLTSGNFDDEVLRSSELKRNNSETFGLRDFVFRSVGMFARIFSAVYKSDKTERFVLANRFLKSEYHVAEKTGVRRWIVRAASSLFGLWDFLRGKIREENCQTELFCPVTLELDLTCEVV